MLALAGKAQSGLEGIIVEKYYVSNANDAAKSSGTLPAGSVTWRIYVDMAPGYKFQAAYGVPTHTLKMTTTTSFFNNTDYGTTTPTFSAGNAKKNTVMLDSWLSVGGACAGYMGVLKSEDNGVGNFVNANGALQNNDPLAGIPLTTQDGMIASASVPAFSTIGIDNDILVFNDGGTNGNSFITSNGAWSCLVGAVGPTATNRVLIAQITTDGELYFELNIQIGTPSGGTEKYVAKDPNASNGEYFYAGLTRTLPASPAKPVVNITSPVSPAHSITGDIVALTANASDADGTVSKVEFFDGATSLGFTTVAPYTVNYTGVAGTHTITAVATDNDNQTTTSSPLTLVVGTHQAPSVVLNAAPIAPNTSLVEKDSILLTAAVTAYDAATISSVQFSVDGTVIGSDLTAPYSVKYYGVKGSHTLSANAIDSRSANGSGNAAFTVLANTPPVVTSVTTSAVAGKITINQIATISATATDDGTVSKVEFFANGVSIGVVTSAPFTVNYTPTVEAPVVFSAIATDNKLASSVEVKSASIDVFDPNALPYEISQVTQKCLDGSVCMPVVSKKAAMTGVIGYDVVLNYDKSKVKPTGFITVSNDLIGDATLTNYVTNIDSANSLMYITIYLKGQASAVTNFHGAGQLFCAQFNKTAAFKSIDTAVFSISSLDESYPTLVVGKTAKAGKFITYKDSTFTGSLKYWADGNPIKYDVSKPNDYLITNIFGCGKTTGAVQPDLNGNFVYDIWNGTSINIKRDIASTTAVDSIIDAYDALLAAQVSAKVKTTVPNVYQIIAMDVNRDGVISAGDASQISKRSMDKIAQFDQVGATNLDWVFVNTATLAGAGYQKSNNFPEKGTNGGFSKYSVPVVDVCQTVPVTGYPDCPLITSDVYTGIMLGDVDGSYMNKKHDGLLKSASVNENEIVFDLSKSVTKDGITTVPVSLTSSVDVQSITLNLAVSQNIEAISANNVNNISSLDQEYFDSTSTFKIRAYNVNAPIPATKSFTLSIKSTSNLSSIDFTGTLVKFDVSPAKLKVMGTVTNTSELNSRNINVYPNPAQDKLNVEVTENSKVEIFNLSGELVIDAIVVNANKVNTIDVQKLSTGVYMLKVYNSNYSEIKKVVIKK